MKLRVWHCLLFVVALSALFASSAAAYWTLDGSILCAAGGDQGYPAIVSDGSGGAIITWSDWRSGSYADIYVQRVNALGAPLWTAEGVAICTAAYDQAHPTILSDGSGGAIITWTDRRNGGIPDIYAQRVNALGAPQWTSDGIAVCAAVGGQEYSTIASDGSDGAIITWHDARSGSLDIYAQRVNASGVPQWTSDGIAICTITGAQTNPGIVSDASGGAIVIWIDYRVGDNWDIYAQRVNASGALQWVSSGVTICSRTGNQINPSIIPDGSGGAFIAWQDYRAGISDANIYAQRINAAGSVQWSGQGNAICGATGSQGYPTIVSDASSGAIITWDDRRDGSYVGIYAQRVDVAGVSQWTVDGVAISTGLDAEAHPAIVSDGSGGAIIAWGDSRDGGSSNIYAQRINASGGSLWIVNGVPICTAADPQENHALVSDGSHGAIITWHDFRNGNDTDIYAQRVVKYGQWGAERPVISSVSDVPRDQGGKIQIRWRGSALEVPPVTDIIQYSLWRRLTSAASLLEGEGPMDPDLPLMRGDEENRAPLITSNGWVWEWLATMPAGYFEEYAYTATSLFDSIGSNPGWQYFMVRAHTSVQFEYFDSPVDSGYSVDNLSPPQPLQFAAQQSFDPVGLILSWGAGVSSFVELSEDDFSHYALYRSTDPDFTPGEGNRIYTGPNTTYFDGDWRWGIDFYYKLSAVDIHGNESTYGLVTPDNVTGVETPTAPVATYLAQNAPNPFNPTTAIRFGLNEGCDVSLAIYDVSGRLVRTLVREERSAAQYVEAWDGRDSGGRKVASGLYFYRLDAGTFRQTRKMVLLR